MKTNVLIKFDNWKGGRLALRGGGQATLKEDDNAEKVPLKRTHKAPQLESQLAHWGVFSACCLLHALIVSH